tara:strand:- start:8037 stop:8414 length:378 start_codon:yes stop_codon:yes gene_type:complete
MYTLPQEVEVWYIIPALRRELSKCMIKDYKVTYEKVGQILGISKAAISQYLKKKRAARIKLHPKVSSEVCKSCEKIVKGKSDSVKEITRILKFIREKELHCDVCGEMVNGELHNCKQVVAKYEKD